MSALQHAIISLAQASFNCAGHYYYCPNKEAAMVSIVVSLTCAAYHWAALIAF